MVELLNRTEATFTSDPLSPEVAALLTELEGRYDRTTEEYLTHHERVAGMKRDELLCQREAALAAVHDEFQVCCFLVRGIDRRRRKQKANERHQDRTRRAEEEMIAHGRVSIMKRLRKEHKMRLPPGADVSRLELPSTSFPPTPQVSPSENWLLMPHPDITAPSHHPPQRPGHHQSPGVGQSHPSVRAALLPRSRNHLGRLAHLHRSRQAGTSTSTHPTPSILSGNHGGASCGREREEYRCC